MARVWPSFLPVGLGPGYRLTPVDQAIRTDMEVGSKRLRRITSARHDTVEVQWKLTDAEMHGFRAWFGDDAWSLAGDSNSLAAWSLSQALTDADTVTGPDLALADRLIDTAAVSQHYASIPLGAGALAGSTILCRVRLRAAGRSWVRFGVLGWDGTLRYTHFDLDTGAWGTQIALLTRERRDLGDGWWQVTITANTGTGATTPAMRLGLLDAAQASTYAGDGISGVDVCGVNARLLTGYDLPLTTSADGRALGAAGGSAWVLMPLAFGGGMTTVEARFDGPWSAVALPGLGWQVTGRMEVRNA